MCELGKALNINSVHWTYVRL